MFWNSWKKVEGTVSFGTVGGNLNGQLVLGQFEDVKGSLYWNSRKRDFLGQFIQKNLTDGLGDHKHVMEIRRQAKDEYK